MLSDAQKQEYYRALLAKDTEYEGIFYVGVTSTNIFCRPTCPARKPKFDNCLFFKSPFEAVVEGFRPCLRCRPLALPEPFSEPVQKLVAAVEENPEKRWRDTDFRALGVDVSTARRQFKKHFGMTFVAYARARRLGIALAQIREGEKVIHAQVEAGYDSSSGFRDAFARILGAPPTQARTRRLLEADWITTPLGPMLAIADAAGLYLLEFADRKGLTREIERLRHKFSATIVPGKNGPLEMIRGDLASYFQDGQHSFKTPVHFWGTPFQHTVWHTLQQIAPGQTLAYKELAERVGRPDSFRAAAQANGANPLALIVPCHRIINANGELGGYAGGLARKEWLLTHEKGRR